MKDSLQKASNLLPNIKSPRLRACWLVCMLPLFLFDHSLLAQGSLTPPGPPGPTMKTLDQLDAKLEKRMPISELPYAISNSGSYYVTANLSGLAGTNGILINANDVSIDLNGFTLTGVPGSLHGITFPNSISFTNITILNGAVRGWGGYGVRVSAANFRLEGLQLTANGSGGIYGGSGGIISHCQAITNSGQGIYSWGSTFDSCMASYNSNDGIAGGNSRFVNCIAQYNRSFGIRAYAGSFVTGCQCAYNARSGIGLGSDSSAVGNHCNGNNSTGGTMDAGIYAFYGNARIENNFIRYSFGVAIMVDSGETGVLVIRNSTSGNTNSIYSIPAGNDVGPWSKAATATSPFANIYN